MPMSFDGHAASSSGCAIKPKVHGTGSAAFVGRTGISLRTGSYAMPTAEHREPCDSRGSCTDLERLGVKVPRATRQLETRNAAGSRDRRESPSPTATDVLVAARRDGESVPRTDTNDE